MSGPANKEGHHIFVDELTRFAEQSRNARLTPIIRQVAGPLRVAVRGRDGVGRGTVAAALSGAGVTVIPDPEAADLDVVVIAEVLKPEDRAMLPAMDARAKPVLVVLNKADLTGFGAGGPMAIAHRRAADYRALTGVPTVPMIGLLATAVLDDELVSALRTLTTEPGGPDVDRRVPADGSPAAPRRPDPAARHAGSVRHRPRRACPQPRCDSRVAAGAAASAQRGRPGRRAAQATGAAVRYRRVRSAVAELRALAVESGDERLTEFLSADDTVIAVMAAAVDVVEAAGLAVDPGDDAGRASAPRGAVAALRPRTPRRAASQLCRRYLPGITASSRAGATAAGDDAVTAIRSPRRTRWWRRSIRG